MKTSKFAEAQIAFVLKQADTSPLTRHLPSFSIDQAANLCQHAT
jgi:hypothetical protein